MSQGNIFEPEFDAATDRPGFRSRRARIGWQVGSERLGASVYELEPGQAAFPFHWHSANEELLIALSGKLVLRTPDARRELEPGEVVSFPVGEEGAHQVINVGDQPARLLMISEMNSPELSGYPDTGRVAALSRPPGGRPVEGQRFLVFREEDAEDYWEGEPPPGGDVTVERIGVAGAGTMGSGIAQLAVLGGFETFLHDPDSAALAAGADRLREGLRKGMERGRWSEADAIAAVKRLQPAAELADLGGCDLVIEAAPEDMAIKHDVFTRLTAALEPDSILATNTSSLSVTAIAAAVEHPQRVVGMHFFNPPPLMRLVEIVAGEESEPRALEEATDVAARMQRTPIRASDEIGFIANRCVRPFSLEALRILGDRIATHEQIDRIVRVGGGFRMGPFEMMDLVGVDVGFEVAKSFWEQSFHEPRWQPHPIQAKMVAAGRLGRKTGRGYYEYGDGPHRPDDPEPSGGSEPDVTAWPGDDGIELDNDIQRWILGRIVCQLVNEAAFALQKRIGSAEDIDTAMRLGFNWPRGPLEWGDAIGPARIAGMLDALHSELGEERYRTAPLLRRVAQAGGALR